MMITFAALILVAAFVLVLITGGVFALMSKSPAVRTTAIVIIVLLLIMPFPLLFLVSAPRMVRHEQPIVRQQNHRQQAKPLIVLPPRDAGSSSTSPNRAASPPEVPNAVPAPVIARVGADESLMHGGSVSATWNDKSMQADVYPSFESAIEPTVEELFEKLTSQSVVPTNDQDQPTGLESVRLFAFGSSNETLLDECRKAIEKRLLGVEVRMYQQRPSSSGSNHLDIAVDRGDGEYRWANWDTSRQVEHCNLKLTATYKQRSVIQQSFVAEKPWVDGFDRFIASYPKRRFVVGYSQHFENSEQAAKLSAIEDAMRQSAIELNGERVTLIDERHVIDRFAQQIDRPYGDVWRQAVLIELPDDHAIAATAHSQNTQARHAFQSWLALRFSQTTILIALVVLTVMLCKGLNWITQGYYRPQVVLVCVGAAALCMLGFLLVFFKSWDVAQ